MRLLYVGLLHDYGDPARGLSYEYWNFQEPLRRLCAERGWDFTSWCPKRAEREASSQVPAGAAAQVQEAFRCAVRALEPDLIFHVPFQGELAPETLRAVRTEMQGGSGGQIIGWFCDDHWRFDTFTARYCVSFLDHAGGPGETAGGEGSACDWYITTCPAAIEQYIRAGVPAERVILSQWAANEIACSPSANANVPMVDVSFVGMMHGNRGQFLDEMMKQLRQLGPEVLGREVTVGVWGTGWRNGRLSYAQVVEVFGRSRITLNLTNAAGGTTVQQMKGRHFEIAACGGFQLTQSVEGLEQYFRVMRADQVVVGEETESAEMVVTYARNGNELAYDIVGWLRPEYDDLRRQIGDAARQRVLAEHTWGARLGDVLDRITGVEAGAKAAAMVETAPRVDVVGRLIQQLRVREVESFPTTCIVLLNWNGAREGVLERCLDSVERNTDCSWRIVCGDNASEDGSWEMLVQWAAQKRRRDRVKIVRFDDNLGCPEGRHRLLGLMRQWEREEGLRPAEYICFLDNDTIVPRGWLHHLIEIAEDSGGMWGALGPRSNMVSGPQMVAGVCWTSGGGVLAVGEDGRFSGYRLSPDGVDKADPVISGLDEWTEWWAWRYRGRVEETGRLVGFCLLVRRDALDRVGSIDPRFGKYGFEDDDLVWRIRLAGWKTAIVAGVFVHHQGQLGGFAGRDEEFSRMLAQAWGRFREKWGLHPSMTYEAYAALAVQYRVGRDWDSRRDRVEPYEWGKGVGWKL